MFKPYQNIILENTTKENIKQAEKILMKEPQRILSVLKNNKKAYDCVFSRLSKIDFKFYKWLNHPIIREIEEIVLAYRLKERDTD